MALEAAHDRSVVHRDLKAANVKLASDGADVSVKVLDIGLAKAQALNAEMRISIGLCRKLRVYLEETGT